MGLELFWIWQFASCLIFFSLFVNNRSSPPFPSVTDLCLGQGRKVKIKLRSGHWKGRSWYNLMHRLRCSGHQTVRSSSSHAHSHQFGASVVLIVEGVLASDFLSPARADTDFWLFRPWGGVRTGMWSFLVLAQPLPSWPLVPARSTRPELETFSSSRSRWNSLFWSARNQSLYLPPLLRRHRGKGEASI